MAKTTRKKIRISELEIFPAAQRKLNEQWAKDIAGAFDPDAVGTFIVSERNGHLYVMDGQTRKRAFEILGKPDALVECLVYTGLTIEEEAALFIKHNTSRAVKAFDKFRVRLTAQEPDALAITKICKAFGLVIKEGANQVNATSAVASLEKVYSGKVLRGKKLDGPTLLETTLSYLYEAWNGEKDAYNGQIIVGLAAFLGRHGESIDRLRMVRQMQRYTGGPSGLIRNARSIQEIRRMQPTHAIASIFVDIHNKGMRSNHLEEWRR